MVFRYSMSDEFVSGMISPLQVLYLRDALAERLYIGICKPCSVFYSVQSSVRKGEAGSPAWL